MSYSSCGAYFSFFLFWKWKKSLIPFGEHNKPVQMLYPSWTLLDLIFLTLSHWTHQKEIQALQMEFRGQLMRSHGTT